MLQSATLAHEFGRAEEFGIVAGEITIDYSGVVKRREKVVGKLRGGVQSLLKAAGVEVVYGQASFTGPNSLRVLLAQTSKGGLAQVAPVSAAQEEIQAAHILVATGSRPVKLNMPGADLPAIIDSDGALGLAAVPRRLVILGAGPAGTQFATIFNRLGSQVSLVEKESSILPMKEPETARVLAASLRKEGVTLATGTVLRAISSQSDGGLTLELSGDKGGKLQADHLLVTVGRVPLTEGLDLERAGVPLDEAGAIPVDGAFRSPVASVLAIGDVTGGAMLAHAAMRQGTVAVERLAGLNPAPVRDDRFPQVVFTDPEVVSIGLTEAQARAQGLEVKTGSFPLAANGRATIYGAESGLVKVVSDRRYGRVLGVHMAGSHLGELTAEAVLALELEATLDELAGVVRTHPSLSEAVGEAAMAVEGLALHVPAKSRRDTGS
jgi:dihydrolipoamide dehydrogenase